MLEVKVFDYADYKNRLASNHELMTLVAYEFISEATSLFDCFQKHFERQNWEKLDDLAHRLKGASLEVSGHKLCDLIAHIEMSLKEEQRVSSELYHDLRQELDALFFALKEAFPPS